jgi:ATP-binding cassette, subfamily B, bacterial
MLSIKKDKFPHFKQLDAMDCGPTCLRIICQFYNLSFSADELRKLSYKTRTGSSLMGISEAAEQIGFRTTGYKIDFESLKEEKPFPFIAHWQQKHFIVIYKIEKGKVYVSDPAYGKIAFTEAEFLKGWATSQYEEGVILTLEPTANLKTQNLNFQPQKGNIKFLLSYLKGYRYILFQLFIGLIIGSLLQLVFPFLTQSIIDIGIRQHNLSFIYLVLMGQLVLFVGRILVEVLRNEILTHLSSRINIHLLTDFFIKLMKLPINFFDVKLTSDILQNINDHQRVEKFLTSGTLNIIFSAINLLVFGGVLFFYNPLIFIVFFIGSLLYFFWVIYFLKKRADLDYKLFTQLSANQSKNLELIQGMQEIKLHNAEKQKRWEWEHLQIQLYKINVKNLNIQQLQTLGSSLINELKNIFITFLAAQLVLNGEITLGMMLSISYIIGQLNTPIHDLVEFMRLYQDATLSIERINEIHKKEEEIKHPNTESGKIVEFELPSGAGGLFFNDVSFKYISDSTSLMVLSNITLTIPENKVTAIVGVSGSGKTTLMKLLLKFYEPNSGKILIGETHFRNLGASIWRENCGVVMQEGYIFSDTIARNIALGEEIIDTKQLINAAKIANIHDFIEELPNSYNMMIGGNGIGLSTGQKQRILIARAIYKNPQYLFFDEATSALDANNEKEIITNLNDFLKGRTAVIIAHRLSTVRDADQIVVLDRGRIAEVGNHEALVKQKGMYYQLIKNQLELGQ